MSPLTQQILGVISIALVFILVAPRVFRLNMALGTTTRNIAIWLLVFTILIFGYKYFNPDASVPIEMPASGPEADNSPGI